MDSNKQFIRDMPMAKRIAWLYHCSNFFRTSVDKLIDDSIERLEEVKIGSLAELVEGRHLGETGAQHLGAEALASATLPNV